MSATNSAPDSAAILQQQSSELPKKKTKLGSPMQQPAAIRKPYIKISHPKHIFVESILNFCLNQPERALQN